MVKRVEVKGLRELGAAMSGLSSDVALRVGRAATNSGAQVIKKLAIEKAPKDTGNLKKNVIVKRVPTSLTSEHIVTVRRGKLTDKQRQRGLEDAFYASFVEFGTVKTEPRPFLRPAFEQGKSDAVQAMRDRLELRITKAQKGGK